MHVRPHFALVTVLSLAVAILAAASVYGLASWARQSADAELELVELRGLMHQLDALEWQAVARKSVTAELTAEFSEKTQDARARLALLESQRLQGMQVEDPTQMQRLRQHVQSYLDAVNHELGLIRQGQIEQAESFDESEVDPSFDALEQQIAALVAARSQSKHRVARFADVGMLISMLLAGMTISVLMWSSDRATEREGLKLSNAVLALQKSEARWQFAMSGAGFAVWDRSVANDQEYSSQRWPEMLGYAATDPFDHSVSAWEKAIHPDDVVGVQAQIQEMLAGQRTSCLLEYRFRSRIGHWIWVASRCMATDHDATGRPQRLIGVREDITETKQLREQITQTQKMQSIGQLAGGIAHDFNNNLTAIMMSVDLLALEGQLSEDGKRTLQELSSMAEQAAKTTAQLLQFARRQPAQMKVIDLADSVRKLSGMLRRLVGEKIAFQLDIASPADQPILVTADANLVDQAIMNLVLNARDAMPDGGRLDLELSVLQIDAGDARLDPEIAPGQFARIRVRDSGVGISEQHMARIFEPFFTTKGVGKGTGLGLASVYGMAHQHQGWVSAESAPNQGSTFDIFLPTQASDAVDSSAQPAPLKRRAERIEVSRELDASKLVAPMDLCVLLVEDEPQVRQSMLRMLTHLGCRVHVAENADQGLWLWQEHRSQINLLLTDLVMPGSINGSQLAHEIRRRGGDLPTLIMSGYRADTMTEPLSERMRFLSKPFDIATFRQQVLALVVSTN